MDIKYLLIILVVIIFTVGCVDQEIKISFGEGVNESKNFVEALEKRGEKVELKENIPLPFFTPFGRVVLVEKGRLQMFEYETKELAQQEATYVSPNGRVISSKKGVTEVDWLGDPHFYLKDRLLVIYLGNETGMLTFLKKSLGEQFAGRIVEE